MTGSSRGQATVEVALLLPLVAVLVLAIGQIAVIARDRVMLTHAARVGARVAAVGGTDADIRREVASALAADPDGLGVDVRRFGPTVEVTVTYRSATDLPLVGSLIDDVAMVAVARMPREPP